MQAHDRSKDGQLCYDEFMRYPPHTHTHAHPHACARTCAHTRAHAHARRFEPANSARRPTHARTRACDACTPLAARRAHVRSKAHVRFQAHVRFALSAPATVHPRTTHAPGMRAGVRACGAPRPPRSCVRVCLFVVVCFAFGRMITPWFTRPPVRTDDASAKHLRGATGEWARRAPSGCLGARRTVSVTLPHGSALLCATLSCRPPERSRWRTLASHAAPEGCESAPTRMLRGACCLERAVRSVSARSTRVLQATSPNSAFHRLVECFMVYFMCAGSLQYMAQPQLVCHSPCHPCMVCDARFSPGQGGEEIAPRSLNRQNARLRQGRARPCHICTGTGLTPAHGLCCCRSTAAPQPRMSVLPTPVDWHRPRAPSRATAAAESLRAAVPCNNVSCGCADVRGALGGIAAHVAPPLLRGLVYVATLAFH